MEVKGVQPPAWVRDAVFYQIFPDRFRNGDPGNDPPGVRPWGELPTPTSFFGGDLWGILEKLDYLVDLGVTALYLTPIFKASTNHRYDGEDYFQVDPALGGNAALRALVAALHRRGLRLILDGVFNHCGQGHPFFRDAQKNPSSPYRDWFVWEEEEPGYACWAGCPPCPSGTTTTRTCRRTSFPWCVFGWRSTRSTGGAWTPWSTCPRISCAPSTAP